MEWSVDMTNKSPDWEIGEYGRGAMLETVELAEALTSADRGTTLKVTGIATDHTLKVSKADAVSGTDTPNFIAIKGSEGAVGDYVEVLLRGDVCVQNVSGAIAVGDPITSKAGRIAKVPAPVANVYPNPIGFARAVFADGDDGLVCFRGI